MKVFNLRWRGNEKGFTAVEILVASVIFPMLVIGTAQGFDAISKSYTTSKQLNEMYAVLSACPELDRALDYGSLSSTTNCFPNNTFTAEGGSGVTYTYTPTLSVADTSSLASSDPLKTIPDSKVVDINVGFIKNTGAPALQLKMLVTRNGIAQL